MTTAEAHPHAQPETIKDTLISIVIAFALAFVFRGFVVEAFVIPTGSMAPTLMGAHMKFRDTASGHTWPVGPWYPVEGQPTGVYYDPQGAPKNPGISVHEPVTGRLNQRASVPLSSGDRILVLKYLYSIMNPARFDVIVFKNPEIPTENYIKRLIGLPGEEIALVDGDVFVRTGGVPAGEESRNLWAQSGWKIARKPRAVQNAVWQTVFDSSHTPPPPESFRPPWTSESPGWTLNDTASYAYSGTARTELVFNQSRPRFASPVARQSWAINDRYPYNEHYNTRMQDPAVFPVSDLRLRAGVEPAAEGLVVEASIIARGFEFQARIEGSSAAIRRRELLGAAGAYGKWKDLRSATISPMSPGQVTNVSLAMVDQSLSLEINGRAIFERYEYDWSPAERIARATGRTIEQLTDLQNPAGYNVLADPLIYAPPQVRWAFSGAPLKLHRVGLDRDIHYQPDSYKHRTLRGPARGTNPLAPVTLKSDQFFACGDNSPASLDLRLLESVKPWVAQQFDDTVGVIPRELLLGRAFFVYWPSLHKESGPMPMPDFGRMRFIW